jgi:SNF2 family DNA or RNA helicase
MGLGKTVQVLAFLSMLRKDQPILVVAPTSLIFNWKKEFEKFLPHKNVYVHAGKDRHKEIEALNSFEVILTSYSHLRRDACQFVRIQFSCIVLDEAQNIKNPESQIAEICFSLRSPMKIAITGTPIENRWDDLWSIFHFLEPQLLEDRRQFDAQMMAAQSDVRYQRRVKKKIAPFILRRTKEDVSLELPEKILQTVWIDMHKEQREIYEQLLSNNRQTLIKKIQEEGVGSQRMQILEALLRLRQVCSHPHLIDPSYADDMKMSAKLERVLSDTAEVVSEGRKVIIFSQFTQMLKILESHIKRLGFCYVYLDGSTRDRESVVSQFQQDPAVQIFLMSLKAGGVGLNLTAGDYVFLFDPWWNDAAEKQAIDRAYRLGRKDVVVARRYVVAQSVEEKIMKIKEMKSQIADGLLQEQEVFGAITTEDLLDLL